MTQDDKLFRTIHMGPPTIDVALWILTVDGLVERPFSMDLRLLKSFPSINTTAFHECYGSPINPPISNLWRIGNVQWTGVRLRTLLEYARPLTSARFVWTDGLDHGEFHGVKADRYQKDLPLAKAMCDEVLVAYAMNGEPLNQMRGGPARLVVPGWFGTNSTKWLCRISVREGRSPSPYTTVFYNEHVPGNSNGALRPVWQVEVNSMIVSPEPNSTMFGQPVVVWGWSWACDEVVGVDVSVDSGQTWLRTDLTRRKAWEWQRFELRLHLKPNDYTIIARALSSTGEMQPLDGRRNHAHAVSFTVE